MNLSLKTWLYVAGIAIVLLAIAVGGKLWLEDHDGHIRAEYELKALHAQYDQLQIERDKLAKEREQIKTDTQAKLDKVSAERDRALKSGNDSAAYVSKYIGTQATIEKPKDEQGKDLPDAPSQLVIKEPSKLAEFVAAAQACQVRLDGCQKELANASKDTQAADAQGRNQAQQISVIDKEKNGTKKAKLKWAAVGALAGGAVVAILKKH